MEFVCIAKSKVGKTLPNQIEVRSQTRGTTHHHFSQQQRVSDVQAQAIHASILRGYALHQEENDESSEEEEDEESEEEEDAAPIKGKGKAKAKTDHGKAAKAGGKAVGGKGGGCKAVGGKTVDGKGGEGKAVGGGAVGDDHLPKVQELLPELPPDLQAPRVLSQIFKHRRGALPVSRASQAYRGGCYCAAGAP